MSSDWRLPQVTWEWEGLSPPQPRCPGRSLLEQCSPFPAAGSRVTRTPGERLCKPHRPAQRGRALPPALPASARSVSCGICC